MLAFAEWQTTPKVSGSKQDTFYIFSDSQGWLGDSCGVWQFRWGLDVNHSHAWSFIWDS